MAEEMDDFVVGSPSKFDWQRQSSSTASSTAQTDGVDSQQGAALQKFANMISTMAELIEASNTYVDTIAERSDNTTEEMKKDVVMLAESILRVEARLSTLEDSNRKRKDTADTSFKDALREINDRIDTMADSVDILEKRLGGIEGRVLNIEQLLMRNNKRRKIQNETVAAKSAWGNKRTHKA
jgi:Mg2+ and Co2+ transporter CorA